MEIKQLTAKSGKEAGKAKDGKAKEGGKESASVELQGWVHDLRDVGGLKFIMLRDSTGIIQITIVKKEAAPELLQVFKELTPESVLKVKGKVQANTAVKSGVPGLEIIPSDITLMAKALPELPISVVEKAITTGQAKRFDWRSLDLRKLRQQAIFKVQSALLEGIQRHLYEQGFIQVFTPCILGVASESGAEVFPLSYFDRKAFLRQDPQLHRQLAIAGGFQKIFDLGPAWRAEQSHTNRHLCEHRVCAVEAAFINDEQDTMRIEEGLIVAALQNVQKRCAAELSMLGVELTIPKIPFPELRFPEVYEILKKKGKNLPRGADLDSEADQLLWEYVQEKYKTEFYFLNRFPFKIKPFYVMRVDQEPEWARSVDLYYKGLELSSGGQREHRYEKIMQAVKEKGMKPTEVEWFTKFFQYGVPPHGGFALGMERLTMNLLNIENIRDCVLFPRDPERLVP